MKTERLTPAERAEAALGAVVLQAEEDVLAGKEGAEATFQAAYRQWARRRGAGLSPAARVGAALGAIFGTLAGELSVPAGSPPGVSGNTREPEGPREPTGEPSRVEEPSRFALSPAAAAGLRPYVDAIRAERRRGPAMPDEFVTWRARTMRWFAERPGYHSDQEARAAQAMKADLWASTTTYLVRHGFLKYAQGYGWTATPKLLVLAGKAEPPLAKPARPTLDDVRPTPGQAGSKPSEARLEERLRVLTYLRAKRRGTLAELAADCEIQKNTATRHLVALRRLGHVETDLTTWEVVDFAAARGAS